VCGGNVANFLAVWRLHKFVSAFRAAYANGTILAGISAGSLCWFQHGVTDSFGDPDLSSVEGLGLLDGSHCPHYDEDAARRPAYTRLVQNGMPGGIAADVGVGLHFINGALHRVVSSRPSARAYRVDARNGDVVETPLEPEFLVSRAG
jgi:peptidase E